MGHNHPKTHSPVGEAGTGSGLRSCWWLKQWEQAAWVGQSQAQHNTAPEGVEISEFCEKKNSQFAYTAPQKESDWAVTGKFLHPF